MNGLTRARYLTGGVAFAVLGIMLWIGQVHVAPVIPDRWMPQAQVFGYSDAELTSFARAVTAAGLDGLYTMSNRWLDGVFAIVFGLWTALMLWPRRVLALSLGALYTITDLAENHRLLALFEAARDPAYVPASGGALGLAGYLTVQKFLALAVIAGAIGYTRLKGPAR